MAGTVGTALMLLPGAFASFGPASAAAAAAASSADFQSLSPVRLVDTRSGGTTVDGAFAGLGPISVPGQPPTYTSIKVLDVLVAGRGGIPANAASVALNVTALGHGDAGFVTVWPCGSPFPRTSTVNFPPLGIVANSTVVGLGTGGTVCVYSEREADVVIDATGSFPAAAFTPITPVRLADTRIGFLSTIDGKAWQTGPIRGGHTLEVVMAGRGGVPSDADALALNITVATSPTGFITAWPCGSERPATSTVNYFDGQVVANSALIHVGTGGAICFYSEHDAHVIVDATGFIGAGGLPAFAPARMLDTRAGFSTVDGRSAATGRLPARGSIEVQIAGRAGVPPDADAVALNITVVSPLDAGYVVAWPCDQLRPATSNINFVAGQIVANSAIVKLGAGNVCLYSTAATDLIVDVTAPFS